MDTVLSNPAFVLFCILFSGLALGNISIKGISFGGAGVLFVALVAGHYQLRIPAGVSELGTALFYRSTRNVALTQNGQLFLEDARQILALEQQAKARFDLEKSE